MPKHRQMPWKCSTKGEGRNQAYGTLLLIARAYWDQVNTASRNEQDVAPIKSRCLRRLGQAATQSAESCM